MILIAIQSFVIATQSFVTATSILTMLITSLIILIPALYDSDLKFVIAIGKVYDPVIYIAIISDFRSPRLYVVKSNISFLILIELIHIRNAWHLYVLICDSQKVLKKSRVFIGLVWKKLNKIVKKQNAKSKQQERNDASISSFSRLLQTLYHYNDIKMIVIKTSCYTTSCEAPY